MNIKFPEGNVDRWYKCSIDKKVLKELSKRSDWQGIKHILIWATILVFSGYMAFLTWGTWWCVLWFLVYGNITYSVILSDMSVVIEMHLNLSG